MIFCPHCKQPMSEAPKLRAMDVAMDTKTAIELAGGQALVARACTNKGRETTRFVAHTWAQKNRLPDSEWTGETSIAQVICDLAEALGHHIHPVELCPGAGQYMTQPDSEAA